MVLFIIPRIFPQHCLGARATALVPRDPPAPCSHNHNAPPPDAHKGRHYIWAGPTPLLLSRETLEIRGGVRGGFPTCRDAPCGHPALHDPPASPRDPA